jgi:hypothetical protein
VRGALTRLDPQHHPLKIPNTSIPTQNFPPLGHGDRIGKMSSKRFSSGDCRDPRSMGRFPVTETRGERSALTSNKANGGPRPPRFALSTLIQSQCLATVATVESKVRPYIAGRTTAESGHAFAHQPRIPQAATDLFMFMSLLSPLSPPNR